MIGIKSTLQNTRRSFKRFPIAMVLSFVLCAVLIVASDLGRDAYSSVGDIAESMRATRTLLYRLASVMGTGILLFVNLRLLHENIAERKVRDKYQTLMWVLGALFLVLLYFYLYGKLQPSEEIKTKEQMAWMGINLSLIVCASFMAKIKFEDHFVGYVIEIFESFAKAMIYALVLFVGLCSIFFTVDKLFELEIGTYWYEYSAYITFIPFFMGIFLSSYPYGYVEDYRMGRPFRVLLVSIIVPLLMVYTVILYLYCGKILFLKQWPKGIVGNLTLWYGLISTMVLFLLAPVQKVSVFVRRFRSFYPIFILPMMVMMFVALYIRVEEYGITQMRYNVFLAGMFVVLSMLYYKWRPEGENIVVPIFLAVLILIALVGPISGYHVERISQNKRLEELLIRNNMLEDGHIVAKEDVPQDDRVEITRVFNNLYSSYELHEIPVLPQDYQSSDFKKTFGFSEEYHKDQIEEENDILVLDYYRKPGIDRIEGYQSVYNFSLFVYEGSLKDGKEDVDYARIDIEKKEVELSFYHENQLIDQARIPIEKFYEGFDEKTNNGSASDVISITGETDRVSYLIYLESLSIRYDQKLKVYEEVGLHGRIYYRLK